MDGRKNITKLIVAFRNFANAPKESLSPAGNGTAMLWSFSRRRRLSHEAIFDVNEGESVCFVLLGMQEREDYFE